MGAGNMGIQKEKDDSEVRYLQDTPSDTEINRLANPNCRDSSMIISGALAVPGGMGSAWQRSLLEL